MVAPRPAPVAVTRTSSFGGAHIAEHLQEAGYEVRGVEAGEELEDALAGCAGLVHVAARTSAETVEVDAAAVVEETRRVLLAATRVGTVRRVVLTSSLGAVTDAPEAGRIFTEEDWNDRSTALRNPHHLATTRAEREAWRLATEAPWSLVTLLPATLLGPRRGAGASPSDALLERLFSGAFPGVFDVDRAVVDVRDVAAAHRLALEQPEASGRHLLVSRVLAMQDLVALLREAAGPDGARLPARDLTRARGDSMLRMYAHTQPPPVGTWILTHLGLRLRVRAGRAPAVLGTSFRPLADTLVDAVADLRERGRMRSA